MDAANVKNTGEKSTAERRLPVLKCVPMMVNLMRTNQRWLMIVISVLVLTSFVWFMSDRTHSDALATDRIGKMYGRTLSLTELQRTERQLQIAARLGLTHLTQREAYQGGEVEAALNDLVLQHEAERQNIFPTDEEVLAAEMQLPAFQGANGEFDSGKKDEVMTNQLTPNGFSSNQLDELVRQDLQVAKLRQIVDAPVVVSPLEVRRAYEQHYAKTEASIIRFQKADFAATVAEPTADEIKKYYDEQKDHLTQPERRKVQYVKFGLDDAQKKLANKERMDALKPQADQAVQFLEQLLEQNGGAITPTKPSSVKPDDQAAASKAREKYLAAVAAAKLTVKETGEFEENQAPAGEAATIPGFAEAAFKLTTASPDSDVPLETADAFYDLHLSGLVPERPLTLDEARPKIIASLKDERATAALAAKAEEIRGKIVESLKAGHTLPEAGKEVGQNVQELAPSSVAEPNRTTPDASAVAVAAQELGTGELSKFVPTSTGGLLVYVRARQGIDEAKFEKDKNMVSMNLRRQKVSYYFYEWLRANREASGAQIDSRLRG